MDSTPNRTRKKFPARVYLLTALVLALGGGITLMVLKAGFGIWGPKPYIGKVVELTGSVSAIGLVERYAKGKSIVLRSVDDDFTQPVYCDLSGPHSIQILAGSLGEFRKTHPPIPRRNADITLFEPPPKPVDESLLFRKFPKLEKVRFEDLLPTSAIPDKAIVTIEGAGVNLALSRANLGLDAERRNLEAAEAFEGKVIDLARKADRMDVEWRRYKDTCLGRYPQGNSRGRDWFGVWEGPPRIANETSPECLKIYDDFSRLSEEIRAGMSDALAGARSDGLGPAQIREIRKKHKMDWSGWEK